MTSIDRQPLSFAKSRQLLESNEQVIPGGLASINRRAEPCIAFAKAVGSHLWDVDGNEYIDYHAAFSAYILGHADADVNAAVMESLRSGRSNYGSGPTADEGELARLFLRCVPGADKVQFFNTGSEATAQAIRVARAWTGRDHVILMQGGYNGNQNVVAANLMNTVEQLGGKQIVGDEYPLVPLTAGIPEGERRVLHAVEFNDLEAVRTLVKRYEVAALITEPVLQNIGVVKPRPGYLEGLRELADAAGFVLIFDEVKTGFRAGLGGYQGLSGVTPDLSTFGKALANGFPIAALAGKQAVHGSGDQPRSGEARAHRRHVQLPSRAGGGGDGDAQKTVRSASRCLRSAGAMCPAAGGRSTQVVSRPRHHGDDQPRGQCPLRVLHGPCADELVGIGDRPRYGVRHALSTGAHRARRLSFSGSVETRQHQLRPFG